MLFILLLFGLAHVQSETRPYKLLVRQTVPYYFNSGIRTLNEDNPDANNYAILDQLESFRQADGKFYFKLQWPGDSTIYEWSQTSNPLTENIAGYEAITVPYTGQYWGGLEPSTNALMDGSVGHGNWFYAVGSYNKWGNGIPAYAKNDSDYNYSKTKVELYIRGSACSAKDYLKYDGISKTASLIQPNVQDTYDCESGYDFGGSGIVKYDSIDLKEMTEFTFMAWVKLHDYGNDVGLFSYGTYSGQCGFMLQLRVNRGNKDFHMRVKSKSKNNFDQYNSNQGIFTNAYINKWFHVAVVKDSYKISFYLNAKAVGSRPFTDPISTCSDKFQLGKWIEGSPKFVDGNVKKINLYSTAKSLIDIQANYKGLDSSKLCSAKITDLENNLKNSEKKLKNTEDKLKNTEDKLQNTEDKLKKTEKDLKDTKKELGGQIENLQTELKNTKKKLSDAEKKAAAWEKRYNYVETNINTKISAHETELDNAVENKVKAHKAAVKGLFDKAETDNPVALEEEVGGVGCTPNQTSTWFQSIFGLTAGIMMGASMGFFIARRRKTLQEQEPLL